jgi:hypothetical protein
MRNGLGWQARPSRLLVVMIPTPFGIAGAPVSQIVLLEVMHLVAGLAAIYFLTMWGQSSGR